MRTVASFIVGVGLTTQACSTVVPVQGADTSDLVGAGADEGSEDEEVAEDTFEAADLDTAGEGTKDSGAGKDSGDTGTSNPQDSGWDSGLGAYDTAGCGYGYVLDCDGACGDAYSNVGDGYCDGVSGSVYGNWDCATWSYDGGDCLVDTGFDTGLDTAGCGYGDALDCEGNCNATWNVGDGLCDDVPGSYWGYWDCAAWSYDGGDC